RARRTSTPMSFRPQPSGARARGPLTAEPGSAFTELAVGPGLTGEHRAQAHELPYAEQAESSPQHRGERGRDECPVICPGDKRGGGSTIGVPAQPDGAPSGGPHVARPVRLSAE